MLLLTGFGLGCLCILAMIVLRDLISYAVARVFLALLFVSALLLVTPLVDPDYQWIVWNFTTAAPALFWLLCQLAFANKPGFDSVWVAVAIYSFGAPAIVRSFGVAEDSGGIDFWLGWQIPRYTEYLLVGRGMWIIIANWSDDLVESRRRLRAAMLIVVGAAIFGITFSVNTRIASDISLPLIVSFATAVSAFFLLKGHEALLPQKNREQSEVSAVIYSTTCMRLKGLMDEGFYRTEYLTLKKLSEELGVSDYKTRMVINQELGYRNFNDYLNQLRIADAKSRLIKDVDAPILNIALDVGYRNVSSFNRAFKDLTTQTPSDYRAKNFVSAESKFAAT